MDKNLTKNSAYPPPQENSPQRLLSGTPTEQSMAYVIVRSGKVTDVEDVSEQHNWVHT